MISLSDISNVLTEYGFEKNNEKYEVTFDYYDDDVNNVVRIKVYTSFNRSNEAPIHERDNAFRIVFHDDALDHSIGRYLLIPWLIDWEERLKEGVNDYLDILKENRLRRCPKCNAYQRYITANKFWGCNNYREDGSGCNVIEYDHTKRIKRNSTSQKTSRKTRRNYN